MKINLLVLATLLCISVPQLVSAHGEGVSFETEVNGYFIDIGYDPEFIEAGQRVRFDFNTYPTTASSSEEVFTDVWVSIEQHKNLIFSGAVDKPTFGATGFNIVLPDVGEYELKARFQNNGAKVAEASFPFSVVTSADTTVPSPGGKEQILAIIAAALLALAMGYGIGRWFGKA